MTAAGGENIFFSECVACGCLTLGTVFLLFAFLMATEILMVVVTISFALLIDLKKSFLNSKNG